MVCRLVSIVDSSVFKIKNTKPQSRRNFGDPSSRKRGEANFVRKFETVFFDQMGAGIAMDEFAVAQHGVADLVWIAWKTPESEDFSALTLEKKLNRRRLYAFEAKLTDWQRALDQAHRYRYFADKAIVVMPEENVTSAAKNLSVFQELGVGLWSFSAKANVIRKHFTPTSTRAFNAKSRLKALRMLSSEFDFRKLQEKV